MKGKLLLSLVFTSFILFSQNIFAQLEKFTIDPMHSFVVWKISHLGFSTQTGKWPVNGELLLDQADPQKSKVDVNIQIKDFVTGIPKLNEHLEGPQFFDAEKFPTAKFVSEKITPTSKETATIDGLLTLHGVTKPVSLSVTLNKIANNVVTDKLTAGFSATAKIHRSDFGVKGFLPLVGDEVDLSIDLEAEKSA